MIWRRLPASLQAPRPRVLNAIRDVDAVVCFGTNALAADVVASCRARDIRCVLFLVHDWEVSPSLLAQDGYIPELNEYGIRVKFALQNADRIVAQTKSQQQMYERLIERRADLIRNPIELEPSHEPLPGDRFVLWVGRAEALGLRHKRPEVLVELARACPEVNFVAIMNPTDKDRFRQLLDMSPDNLKILEQLSSAEIESCFASAAIFLSTSAIEGFPNTFLQAAKYSVPIVSLDVDPDSMLRESGCGFVCDGSMEKLRDTVRRLWNDENLAQQIGRTARTYVEENHEISGRLQALVTLLEAVVAEPRSAMPSAVACDQQFLDQPGNH